MSALQEFYDKYGKGFMRSANNALLLGGGDEYEAYMLSLSRGDDYEKTRRNINKEQAQFAEEHPYVSGAGTATGIAGQIAATLPISAGSVATAAAKGLSKVVPSTVPFAEKLSEKLASTVPTMGQRSTAISNWLGRRAGNMATGYGMGSVQGYLEGNTPEERQQKASDQGFLGMVQAPALGAGLEVVSRYGAPVAAAIQDKLPESLQKYLPDTESRASEYAAQKIKNTLARNSAEDLGSLSAKFDLQHMQGAPATLMGTDPSLARLTEGLVNRAEVDNAVTGKIYDKLSAHRGRVNELNTKAFGKPDYFDRVDELKFLRKQLGNKDYTEAFEYGTVTDPRLEGLLDIPYVKKAYKEAQELNNARAANIIAEGGDPSIVQMEDVYRLNPKGTAPDGVEEMILTKMPDVRSLHHVQQQLRESAEAAYATPGKASYGKEITTTQKKIQEILDEATKREDGTSAYGAARARYADLSTLKELATKGYKDFNKMTHEEVGKLVADFTPEKKQAFLSGVSRYLEGTVDNPKNNLNFAKLSPAMEKKLKPLFPSESHFDLYKAGMQREAEMQGSFTKIFGNSATAQRAAQQKAWDTPEDAQLSSVAIAARDLATSGPLAASMRIVPRILNVMDLPDNAAKKAAKWLVSDTPAEVAAAVRLIDHYSQQAGIRRQGTINSLKTIAPALAVASSSNPTPVLPEQEGEGSNDYDLLMEKIQSTLQDTAAGAAENTPDLDSLMKQIDATLGN